MKRPFCLLLSVSFALSLCGCGVFFAESGEDKAYSKAITALFDAIDGDNADAVYRLFSPAVREQDEDLKEQIGRLLSIYSGPTDEIGWDGLLASEASYESGEKSKKAYTTFPIRSGDTYYWCYMDLTYENTADENQVGITSLIFFSADEYCSSRYDEEAKLPESVGLEIHADRSAEEEIRCIDGNPLIYSSATTPLTKDAVKEFLKTSLRFSDFKTRFGEPNAEYLYTFYELEQEGEEPRYLKFTVNYDFITYVSIVDDFKYVETVFDKNQS